MSHDKLENRDRLIDLAIELSTTGLAAAEQQEFSELTCSPENREEAERFELTAAALDVSYTAGHQETMPRDVHDRLLLAAGDHLGADAHGQDKRLASQVELSKRESKAKRFNWREVIALAVTAASVALLLSGYNPFAKPVDQPLEGSVAVSPKTPNEKLDALLAANPADLVNVDWTPMQSDTTTGKVVWSDSKQEGYMVFEGLPVNDPGDAQYQLWIFDTDKKQEHPVDGGVFDIANPGTSVIPIDARIPVDQAVMFAITIEKPGGVVVSERKKIPVLAEVVSAFLP